MTIARFPMIGKTGALFDSGLTDQPDDGYSYVRNVRFRDGVAEQVAGHSDYGVAHTTPLYHLAFGADANFKYWVGGGLTKLYTSLTGTGAWTDITRTSGGNYTATSLARWNSTTMSGIMILNNGQDVPQFWTPTIAATHAENLTNWDSSKRCKVIRAHKNVLIALNITTATQYPHRVLWSHPADPGTVPSSWDIADATKDAGQIDLPGDDLIIDGGTLRDSFIIYKERSTHVMRFVGGQYIFAFNQAFTESGILAPNCWTEFNGQHFVMTNSDIIRHDGIQAESILDGRMRKWLFNNIDGAYAKFASFVCKQWFYSEIWFCFPEAGHTECNLAIVWNWKSNVLSIRDLPDISHAESGIVGAASSSTWDGDPAPWISDSLAWNVSESAPTSQRLLMCSASASKNYLADDGYLFGSDYIPAVLERTGLTFGAPDKIKFVRSIRPRFKGAGNSVTLQLGSQADAYSAVTWGTSVTFTIGTDYQADFLVAGRYIAFRLTSETYLWQLDGLDFDYVIQGDY